MTEHDAAVEAERMLRGECCGTCVHYAGARVHGHCWRRTDRIEAGGLVSPIPAIRAGWCPNWKDEVFGDDGE